MIQQKDLTRTLDYYATQKATISNGGAIKKNGTSASDWWLRTADNDTEDKFFFVNSRGRYGYNITSYKAGVSPAFRIG
ncbi:MAG: DUF6273 domain-containing protein [Clostridium sp.]|nr:MAG: DUF6273 domain-containing protein [Clostridium sp.]